MTTPKKSSNADTTLLVLIIDRSGSMESIREDMEGGIKTLQPNERRRRALVSVTLVQLDDHYEVWPRACRWPNCSPYHLIPRGSTALLDAIGRTISHVRARSRGSRRAHHRRRDHRRAGERQQRVEPSPGDGLGQGSGRDEGWHFTSPRGEPRRNSGRRSEWVVGRGFVSYLWGIVHWRSRGSPLHVRRRWGRMRRGESKTIEYTEDERRRSAG